jgi:hypothetical protein
MAKRSTRENGGDSFDSVCQPAQLVPYVTARTQDAKDKRARKRARKQRIIRPRAHHSKGRDQTQEHKIDT